jgi:glucosyl-dolichyl phosphate glucuronosyltransferase
VNIGSLNDPTISIIICTRNRAASLRQTLDAIGRCQIPEDLASELLVIDNGSSDDTRGVVESMRLPNMPVHYFREERHGQCHARNRGLEAASGRIILFTDDDIRVPPNWIEAMCRPILEDRADATVGMILMAPHLRRPWLEGGHFGTLACNDSAGEPSRDLIGANMAFSRRTLEKVPRFDTELGPGPAAGGDDTLFSYQLQEAGFRIHRVSDAVVEHHFSPDRLSRQAMRRAALNGAVSDFYIGYHWQHRDLPYPWWYWARCVARLWYYRLSHLPQWWTHESMPAWEKGMLQEAATAYLYARHRGEARRYSKRGLIKNS